MIGPTSPRRWDAALREHDRVLHDFVAAFTGATTPTTAASAAWWQRPPAPGKWTPAAIVLHVCRAYELGASALTSNSPGMRLLVPPVQAWLGRTVLLPVVLASERFPRGARAPAEVVPDAREAAELPPAQARTRLLAAAASTAALLRRAAHERPATRITHAYFGPLPPYTTLRLLSAHTRHHRRGVTPPAGDRASAALAAP